MGYGAADTLSASDAMAVLLGEEIAL